MSLLKSMLRYSLYPGWLFLVAVSALAAYRLGMPPELIVMLAGAASFALTAGFERFMPYRGDWNRSQNDLATDITSFGVLAAIVDPALKIAGVAMMMWIAQAASPYTPHLLPATLPLAVQVAFAFLLIEFGKYWAHRWHHENPFLWDFHAMHHSVERLYALNNFRLHPINQSFSYFLGVFPIVLLGVPPEALLIYSAVAIAVSFFQHANIDLRFGPLGYVFSTNELHRWHHSTRLAEGNRNYGSVLIVWDLLFKTYFRSEAKRHPERIGIDDRSYPKRGYLKQVLWPYCVRHCQAAR
jgi:sterol desaturase/sphingolipid hydroxylase (fatty acid hydroxylase superfamily)